MNTVLATNHFLLELGCSPQEGTDTWYGKPG